jgi:hypothetical protein
MTSRIASKRLDALKELLVQATKVCDFFGDLCLRFFVCV